MVRSPVVQRVVLVVLDGLRADAITSSPLYNFLALASQGASTLDARTVSPSVTAAAMGSLLTGASPSVHGLVSDRFHVPRSRGRLHPLPATLAAAGLPTTTFVREIPWLFRGVGRRIAAHLGVSDARFGGRNAHEILHAAAPVLRQQRRGLIVLHWPDADIAGHARGWMTQSYRVAARRMDGALGMLADLVRPGEQSGTLLVALADHGGGGIDPRNHESDHPLDRTIPMLFVGAGVRSGTIAPGANLLDVPPTILAALGVGVPSSYDGRVLSEMLEVRAAA